MNPSDIIEKYCEGNEELKELLVLHSTAVAQKALQISRNLPHLQIDTQFVEEAAMLHDIGICKTAAPGIHCHGNEPYICHGTLGAEILRKEGLPRHARVAERHTGAGISAKDIESQHLPLPAIDLLPETMEEKLICYADKFFSKSHPEKEKTLAEARRSLQKFGESTVERFEELVNIVEK